MTRDIGGCPIIGAISRRPPRWLGILRSKVFWPESSWHQNRGCTDFVVLNFNCASSTLILIIDRMFSLTPNPFAVGTLPEIIVTLGFERGADQHCVDEAVAFNLDGVKDFAIRVLHQQQLQATIQSGVGL